MSPAPETTFSQGDEDLWAVLRFHSEMMSGGAETVIEVLPEATISRAADGFESFGLSGVAALIRAWLGDDLSDPELAADYEQLIVDDEVLTDAFERRFQIAPQEFSVPEG